PGPALMRSFGMGPVCRVPLAAVESLQLNGDVRSRRCDCVRTLYLTCLAWRAARPRPLVHPLGDRAGRAHVPDLPAASDLLAAAAVRLPHPALVADVGVQGAVSDRERLQHVG